MRTFYKMMIITGIVFAIGVIAFACIIQGSDIADTGSFSVKLIIGFAILYAVFLCAALLYAAYINKHFINPLNNVKKFAERVSEGNFDQLNDDIGEDEFGPFYESFDIMRNELAKSRDREIAQRKKETEHLSSLAGELKAPLTGIKLTTELLRTKFLVNKKGTDEDAYIIEKLDGIISKADRIDDTVYDMLSSTLDELGEIRVVCSDTDSRVLADILKKHDEDRRISVAPIPNVLIHVDTRRMNQVIGNIISNSYKYANTGIEVAFLLADEFLSMKITDHGPGVPEDEIGLITDKYFRGRMWADGSVEGSGLGLYTAKTLMEKMGGHLYVENTGDGLCVALLIKLS